MRAARPGNRTDCHSADKSSLGTPSVPNIRLGSGACDGRCPKTLGTATKHGPNQQNTGPPHRTPDGEPILTSRLAVPRRRESEVARERLNDRLSASTGKLVTVVSAPAGAGKTCAVASWARARQPPGRLAWMTLEEGDDRAGVFWSYVVESLRYRGIPLDENLKVPPRSESVDRRFLAGLAASLAKLRVSALLAKTEGWVGGLRLYALALQHVEDPDRFVRKAGADVDIVAEYLRAEVLDTLPPPAQDLLRRVSVLDRVHPDLADALTGRHDAAGILNELARNNGFIERIEQAGPWYRFHPMFAAALHDQLAVCQPGIEPELHRRAAHWLARAGCV